MIPLYKIRGLTWKKITQNRWEANTIMGKLEVVRCRTDKAVEIWINGDLYTTYTSGTKIKDAVKYADTIYRRLLVQNALFTVCEVDDRGVGSIM